MDGFTDGYFAHGLLIYGPPISRRSVIAKGAEVTMPDISTFSKSRLRMFRQSMQSALSMLGEGEAMQAQWFAASDYGQELAYYDHITAQGFQGREVGDWARLNREMLSARYHGEMSAGNLRRERIIVWFTKCCDTLPKKLDAKIVDTYIRTIAEAMENRILAFRSVLADGEVRAMNDEENYLHIMRYFNRDTVNIPDEQLLGGFDREASIGTNCIQSAADSIKLEDGTVVFQFAGRFHAQFVIKRWPNQTTPVVLRGIMEACNRDVAITLNVLPLDIEKEIAKEDRHIQRMRRMNSDPKQYNASAQSDITRREGKVAALSTGDERPLEAMMTIRVWADDMPALRERCVAIRAAISMSGGAKCHEVGLGAQAKQIFFASNPGWTRAPVKEWHQYATNKYLADLLPMQSSFVGKPEPEAVYYGENNNLGGIRLFTAGTPHHAFVVGVTRSGKSVLMIDLLTQTDPFFGFTAIIEEGLSYGTYTQLSGGGPIIISTDTPYVFNMFDTQGLPLTGGHLNAIVALLGNMIGRSGKSDVDRMRGAMLGEYVQRLYEETAETWSLQNPTDEIYRDALATHRWFKEKMPLGSEFIEAFLECRRLREEEPGKWREWRAIPASDAVMAFAQEPATRRLCRDYIFHVFKPEDYECCRLASLVEGIKYSRIASHEPGEAKHLATMLTGWTADAGKVGSFFDGVSNFNPNGSIVHFELGQIGKGATELKECVGFLISHWVRQHIIGMPRSIRKRVIFEEIAKFFDIPGGEDIIQEFAAQLGKHACWLCSITQVYAQIKHMPLCQKLIGNCSLFFLLKQKDPDDLADLAESIGIPESAQERILRYVIPANQPPKTRASQFTVLTDGPNGPMCGSLRCVATNALIYAASSTGEEWEARRTALAKYPSALEGVLEEVRKKELLSSH
jgi:hypothetical protein